MISSCPSDQLDVLCFINTNLQFGELSVSKFFLKSWQMHDMFKVTICSFLLAFLKIICDSNSWHSSPSQAERTLLNWYIHLDKDASLSLSLMEIFFYCKSHIGKNNGIYQLKKILSSKNAVLWPKNTSSLVPCHQKYVCV